VVIAISTSGRSPNVIAGIEVARERALKTIAFTGSNGGQLASFVDIPIIVPSVNTARIQECHITIGHILCEIIESSLLVDQSVGNGSRQPATPQAITGNSKLVDWDTLLAMRKQWRAEGKTVVWTNGCFDLLHIGHVRGLEAARNLGDTLVVGVNSDDSVRQLKGSGRPIIPASERVQVIAALACVDYVVIFNELTPEAALARLKPEVHCKGADYAPPRGKPIPETMVVESYGGRIEFLPFVPSTSTSDLIRRVRE
jgi:D-glycero-beta-D-manno-heptose 1-phosphate adenylyltransferase